MEPVTQEPMTLATAKMLEERGALVRQKTKLEAELGVHRAQHGDDAYVRRFIQPKVRELQQIEVRLAEIKEVMKGNAYSITNLAKHIHRQRDFAQHFVDVAREMLDEEAFTRIASRANARFEAGTLAGLKASLREHGKAVFSLFPEPGLVVRKSEIVEKSIHQTNLVAAELDAALAELLTAKLIRQPLPGVFTRCA